MIIIGAEKNVENRIKKDLKDHHYWYTKIFANAYTKKGIPDIVAVINRQFVALELKRPTGGKPTPIQIRNLQEIANNGGLSIITNDPHIVEKIHQLQFPDPKSKPVIFADLPDVFYQPALKRALSPAEAAKLWQHPTGQPTPKTPYSVVILPNKEA